MSSVKMQIRHFFELLYLLVQKELKVRYKNSFLGYLWALANPFAFALVYYIAFKIIMRVDMPNYSLFLLAALFPWVWLSNALVHATGCYRKNASLVKRVNLQRAVLPLSNVVHEMVHFCFAIPVILLFILVAGEVFYAAWIWQLPLMMLLQLMMVYPLALLLALANVYANDVEYLVGIVMSMLFFLTPIVYPLSMVPEKYHIFFDLSPISALMQNWRSVLLHGSLDSGYFLFVLATSLILAVLAYMVYSRASVRIGELL